jgi:hypothetical protein
MSYAVTNPATGETVKTYPTITDAELEAAIAAASEAHRTWSKSTTVEERAALIRRVGELRRAESAKLSLLNTNEVSGRIQSFKSRVSSARFDGCAQACCRPFECRVLGKNDIDRNWGDIISHATFVLERAEEYARGKRIDHLQRDTAAKIHTASSAKKKRSIAGKAAEPSDELRERLHCSFVAASDSAR